jgi:hypothetical protein
VTILVAGIACVLSLLGAGLARDLAVAASDRARAQGAADAAALAAVAESAPGGGGSPAVQATLYARRNGARLVTCRCRPGGLDAYVRVAVGDVVAEARAVLEPHLLAPLRTTPDAAGLQPALRDAVERLLVEAGGSVSIVSGHRSREEQTRLWTSAVARYGSAEAADDWVAPPGQSMHERGLAVDLGGDLDRAVEIIDRLGLPLHRPLANEPWHFELRRSRG